jgi:apolipoprotein D and lipocalin family protein
MATVRFLALFLVGMLSSCALAPSGAVEGFEADRYLGQWYEVARMDFYFEKGMNNTTASYAKNPDQSIRVLNRGFDTLKKQWKSAEGTAKFRGSASRAELKVSFFGPFYAAYNVVALDSQYRHALVTGKNLDYLWILSRDKSLAPEVRKEYLERAAALGYDTTKLVWVRHD